MNAKRDDGRVHIDLSRTQVTLTGNPLRVSPSALAAYRDRRRNPLSGSKVLEICSLDVASPEWVDGKLSSELVHNPQLFVVNPDGPLSIVAERQGSGDFLVGIVRKDSLRCRLDAAIREEEAPWQFEKVVGTTSGSIEAIKAALSAAVYPTADDSLPSLIELALRRAFEASGIELLLNRPL